MDREKLNSGMLRAGLASLAPALRQFSGDYPFSPFQEEGGYHAETYHPEDSYNPKMGAWSVGVRPESFKRGQGYINSLLAGEMLHGMGATDSSGEPYNKKWYDLKKEYRKSYTPKQEQFARKRWKESNDPRPFEDFMERSWVDQDIRGAMYPELMNRPDENLSFLRREMFTPKQKDILRKFDQYLYSR